MNTRTIPSKTVERDTLIAAHGYAAAFHSAMERALWYEREIEEHTHLARTAKTPGMRGEWASELPGLEKSYREAVAESAEALRHMPAVWAAVLNIKVGE